MAKAAAVLAELLDSDDERTRLLAAKCILEHGARPMEKAADTDKPKDEPIEVRWVSDYRAAAE